LYSAAGLAISGNDLFVGDFGSGTIGEYNLDGTPVNPSLITGLQNPVSIAVVPEPGTLSLLGLGGLIALRRARWLRG
jgi:hypothetical protein